MRQRGQGSPYLVIFMVGRVHTPAAYRPGLAGRPARRVPRGKDLMMASRPAGRAPDGAFLQVSDGVPWAGDQHVASSPGKRVALPFPWRDGRRRQPPWGARRCAPPRTKAGVRPGARQGRGLAAAGLTDGDVVTERQAELLLGEGRHPDADRIERELLAQGRSPAQARATVLGRPIEHNRSPKTDKAKERTPGLGFDLWLRGRSW